jgi:hypothetical protein
MIALFSPLARGEMGIGCSHSQELDDNSQVLNVGDSSTLSGVCQDRRTAETRWGLSPSQVFGTRAELLRRLQGCPLNRLPLHADPIHTHQMSTAPKGTDQARTLSVSKGAFTEGTLAC